jgi:hypothetical protein
MMKDFKASDLVRTMRKSARLSVAEVAMAIDRSPTYFNNKLFRNSWKPQELFKLADVCHCDLIYADGYLEVFNSEGMKVETFRL